MLNKLDFHFFVFFKKKKLINKPHTNKLPSTQKKQEV